jgi:hypothetical protein
MMNASEQIESLTNRAASVNQIEQEIQKFREEAKTFQSAAANAEIAAKSAADRYGLEKQRRLEAEHFREEEYRECAIVIKSAQKAEVEKVAIQDSYRRVFIGIVIFTVTLAVFVAYEHKRFFVECGQWFVDRWTSVVSISIFFREVYLLLFDFMVGKLPGLTAEWHYIITTATTLIVIAIALALLRVLFIWAENARKFFRRRIRKAFSNELRTIVVISMSICLLYCCIFFYEPITKIVPMNIFSIWLIISAGSAIAVLLPAIFKG